MKFLFQIASALALAAGASAEADPALLYSGLGYGYAGLAAPLVYGKSAPCVNAANVPVPCAAGTIAYAAPYGIHAIGKREAEAEADPALLYSGLGYAGLAGYGYGLGYAGLKSAPCVNAANIPVPCAAGHIAYTGIHAIGKREAEADPALLYSGLGYAGLGYGYAGLAAPYTTAAVAAPVIAAPAVYNTGTKAGNLNLLGGIHSSNLGVCLNNEGVQVPC
jgi:hypothetical protein